MLWAGFSAVHENSPVIISGPIGDSDVPELGDKKVEEELLFWRDSAGGWCHIVLIMSEFFCLQIEFKNLRHVVMLLLSKVQQSAVKK